MFFDKLATATSKYDPFGRRIEKTVNGTTTTFLYDGDQLIAEYNGAGNLITKYIYGLGIDEPIKGLSPQGSVPEWFYHYDGLGSVTNLTDSTGAPVESYSYDAFGKPSTTSAIGNRFMFTGREYDSETGLYYYRARYYSPGLGRFLQRDPVGYVAGINLYTYCDSVGKPAATDVNLYLYAGNNPVNFTDPYGLWYIDLNVSVGWWGGVTGGVMINDQGIYPYAGGGVVSPPGGVSVTWSPSNPTTGWNVGASGGYWGGGQVGYGFGEEGGWFWEAGFVTPGGSLTGYYVWKPWKWPWQQDNDKKCK